MPETSKNAKFLKMPNVQDKAIFSTKNAKFSTKNAKFSTKNAKFSTKNAKFATKNVKFKTMSNFQKICIFLRLYRKRNFY